MKKNKIKTGQETNKGPIGEPWRAAVQCGANGRGFGGVGGAVNLHKTDRYF